MVRYRGSRVMCVAGARWEESASEKPPRDLRTQLDCSSNSCYETYFFFFAALPPPPPFGSLATGTLFLPLWYIDFSAQRFLSNFFTKGFAFSASAADVNPTFFTWHMHHGDDAAGPFGHHENSPVRMRLIPESCAPSSWRVMARPRLYSLPYVAFSLSCVRVALSSRATTALKLEQLTHPRPKIRCSLLRQTSTSFICVVLACMMPIPSWRNATRLAASGSACTQPAPVCCVIESRWKGDGVKGREWRGVEVGAVQCPYQLTLVDQRTVNKVRNFFILRVDGDLHAVRQSCSHTIVARLRGTEPNAYRQG